MKLKNLPQPIRELAEKRIREQGNMPNGENNFILGKDEGGFNWSETEDGFSFWHEIYKGNFDVFYKLNTYDYTIRQIDQLNPSDLAKVAEYVNEKLKNEAK